MVTASTRPSRRTGAAGGCSSPGGAPAPLIGSGRGSGSFVQGRAPAGGSGPTALVELVRQPAPIQLSYRWFRSGVAISGATQAKYTLTAADYGKVIKLAVTGTKTGYAAVTKYSAGTRAVAPGVFRNVTPTIAGSAKVGQTLTANPGNWGVSGVTFTYKWYRNGATISGATQASYRLTSADKGKKITVKVTGKASRYYTATKTSRATAKVS